MHHPPEIELKFLVPAAARAALAAEIGRGTATLEHISLAAAYLDTPDRRLARAGIAWRLRREGRRWIQTLKAPGRSALERFEHEVIRPDGSHDAALHAGTPAGGRLMATLAKAAAEGVQPCVRFRVDVRRTLRRIRARGAVVEVALDEGWLTAGDSKERIREVEFELVTGSPAAMLTLAERWRRRFGLVFDPRSKAERGDRLAAGSAWPAVRKAVRPAYGRDADPVEAFGCVLDECLAQITRNAVGLSDGNPAQRVDHVHQLRVGIRRLRSALRTFEGWVPPPPADLVEALRALFAALGAARDSDVLGSGVAASLVAVGAPPLEVPESAATVDPAALLRTGDAQRLLLAWIAWRAALAEPPAQAPPTDDSGASGASGASGEKPGLAGDTGSAAGTAATATGEEAHAEPPASAAPEAPPTLRRRAEKRLRRWHQRIALDWKAFDALDDEGLHALRKRIKRQRYAVEFLAPLLRRGQVDRYLEALATTQDRMGELNDLFVARARYQSLVASEPAAWFALGWLAARIVEVRGLARPALGAFVKRKPPTG